MTASALYDGETWHRRLAPAQHFLRYRLFMLLLDLDEAPDLDRRLRLFGYNRPALMTMRDRDHLDGLGLRGEIDRLLATAGIAAGGRIEMLAMPRLLGQAFNPLTVYFCYAVDAPEEIAAVLYEVNNTFGERHSYLLRATPGPVVRHDTQKRFFVSPFMDMDLTYRFAIRPPRRSDGSPLSIRIRVDRGDETLLLAAFHARRRPLDDKTLVQALARHPLLAAKVVGGIHWEALRLWSKGLMLRPRPAPPTPRVTIGA